MATLEPTAGLSRRTFLRSSLAGALSWWALGRRARAARPVQASACILLWMNGGPSHVDTWDPKQGSTFKPIATRVDGVSLCEHLPQLAERAQHLAILRGLSSREGNHDRAHHLLHTGYAPNGTVEYPSLGAWASHELGSSGEALPAFVSVNGPSLGAGFLGVQHGPLVVPVPNRPPQNTEYPRNVDMTRFLRRRSVLQSLERQFLADTGDAKVRARDVLYQKAVRMMYSPRLAAFELEREPEAVRAAYGDSNFGRGCLLARRLVEAGTRFVEVVLDGWDTHVDNFGRTRKLMAQLDPAFSTLLGDLEARDLLRSTLIVCVGEFGRSPKVNERDGRDHYPQAFSAVLAGGGVRGGVAHGATDETGAKVVSGGVRVPDLHASIATLLGMDPQRELPTPRGRPVTLTDGGQPIREIFA